MNIDYATRGSVGYQYLLDQMSPCSPYGAEHVRRPHWYGPKERDALLREWSNVQAACEGLMGMPAVYDRLCQLMMQLRDIRGTLHRMQETPLTEIELFEVKRFALQLSMIAPEYAKIAGAYDGIAISDTPQVLEILDPDGKRLAGFALSGAYARPLAQVREEKRLLERQLRQAEGSQRDTLLNERRLLVAREEAEMLAVRKALTGRLCPYGPVLLQSTQMLGRLDYTIQRAALARRLRCARPTLASGGMDFREMFNPQVEAALGESGRAFTRVSIQAPMGATIITGANMGGKSVALKTLVLNVLLCQTGFFAAARAAALPLFDAVYFVDGDASDVQAGLSSFGAEVLRLDEILAAVDAGTFCLVALDEPARGTNPREGAALVRALVERLAGAAAVSVLATHYDGVARGAQAHYQAAGLRPLTPGAPEEDGLAILARHMDYGLRRVDQAEEAPKEAVAVMRLLGVDAALVDRMVQLLGEDGTA